MATIKPQSEALRQAIKWLAAMQKTHPEKNRQEIIREAEIRFNLSPRDCEFLDKNFGTP
jgi:hypothetical protein